ncbi:Alpha-2-macroglobulin RAP protein, partial [Teladorsagia circumcincta]
GELNNYDNVYMDTKATHKSRSAEEFASQMEKIDKKLVTLLEKYDLQQAVHAFKEVPMENSIHFDDHPSLDKKAQMNGNFSQKDLDIMKDELLHFDIQLKKIAFHKKELDARREERQKQGKMTLHAVEDVELEAKHEKMERKLRKLEKYLDSKIRHSEL